MIDTMSFDRLDRQIVDQAISPNFKLRHYPFFASLFQKLKLC